jgi:DNA-binding CsgD family transcriptional regulator
VSLHEPPPTIQGEDPAVEVRKDIRGLHARTLEGEAALNLNPLDPTHQLPLTSPVGHLIREERLSLRVPLNLPLSRRQLLVVALLSEGYKLKEIADLIGIKERAVREHIERAAPRIPGDLPSQARLIAWYRGATLGVLTGKFVWDLHTLPKQVAPLAARLAKAVSSARAAVAREEERDAQKDFRADQQAHRAPAGDSGASDDDVTDDVLTGDAE